MLKLTNIVKDYDDGANRVHALKGVSIEFRPSEFVCILGHSGCGKTTLLNIIGGLDQYTSGDLVIRGRSTRQYKSRDWDAYRNHSVGFVFQSYNLIPHQTVLANVELALTLSGVGRRERRRRAAEALEKVGLGDQLRKKPNQLSGGQMQRVAIARALVNDPEILLADEPTGALDSETSVQIMELLKEVARNRLVIMVTHNPDLAERYATRIVRLVDGKITSDSRPYDGTGEEKPVLSGRVKHTSMSPWTALSLSLNNLMTKKGRTILTAFAGSIGIIGIALILSLSAGMQNYITAMEQDTLSSYPLSLQGNSMDAEAMMASMMRSGDGQNHSLDQIYSKNIMTGTMDMMLSGSKENNLKEFKTYIESGESGLEELTTDIAYGYDTQLNLYKADLSDGAYRVNPSQVIELMGVPTEGAAGAMTSASPMMSNADVWKRLVGDNDLLRAQYDVLAGRLPESWNEVVVVVDENNEITDYTLYSLGLLDVGELKDAMAAMVQDEEPELDTSVKTYTYEEILALRFKLLPNTGYYEKRDGVWVDRSDDQVYLMGRLADAQEISVVGILRPGENAAVSAGYGFVGYLPELMERLIDEINDAPIVKEQRETPEVDVFTGLEFAGGGQEQAAYTMEDVRNYISSLPEEQQREATASLQSMQAQGMSDGQIAAAFAERMGPAASTATYEGNLALLGVADLAEPSSISLYPVDFEAKDDIERVIARYNADRAEVDQLTYTDYVGLMMSSITTIINSISYVLIAFVAISLVVSSIMIGIITNISVLERTKEIGILRAIGASKGNVAGVFTAETLIVGFAAGLLGIGVTLLAIVPINAIIEHLAGIANVAALPPAAAVVLVAISMVLTFIAGLFPSHSAANKDPVVALRTE